MPKIGMEPMRRRELISAAIRTIGQRGSLDVTVAQIAHEAGVSPALAHHYFGGKEQLMLATMRHLLHGLGRDLSAALRRASSPRERISAIVAVNFSASQFAPETVAAWLTFYVHAQQSAETRRLLRVYARRLHSNLAEALARLTDRAEARFIAEGAGALIDGLYIRHALGADAPDAASATALVEDYIATKLAASGAPA
ncbi:transcriptional regulator BetI [Mesorhizobium sp. RMAD-H1]|uniref:transcriptional regulator BetI n=1 Tax=Mesorhizobium sp. RMAD-H1 TaxID=2587065 RepID=UPI00160B889A|nr:transcriptional regulator BetI [Mesorhizobium sp. RMAD-H1]MBB2970099.1 TetR/AcrR family transcriptional repressor of bet genes [Mesorhizobium sp. RMAD-H1]